MEIKKKFMFLCMLGIIFIQSYTVDGGWSVVFKAFTNSSTALGVYDLYAGNTVMNANNPNAQLLDMTVRDHYKSDDVNRWGDLSITEVRLSIHKDNAEKAYYIFNGTGTDRMNWMSRDRLLATNYLDLIDPTTPVNIFSIYGLQTYGFVRPFHINRNYGGCSVDAGWLLVFDVAATSSCPWESILPVRPIIIFSPLPQSASQYSTLSPPGYVADFLAIQIYTEEPDTTVATEEPDTTVATEEPDTTVATKEPDTTVEIQTTPEIKSMRTNTSGYCRCFNWPEDSDPDEIINEIIKDLKIEKTSTSKYFRSKNSIMDDRPSAQYVGYTGIIILCIVLGLILIIDTVTFCKSRQ